MKEQPDIISDFEELLKLKEFYNDKKIEAYNCTYERISHSLKNEYIENIESKLERWINVTHILYLKDCLPVKFYLQSKMLYRDGFYEATITMARAICEIICYDLLIKIPHPFGDLNLIDKPIFRSLINYLSFPHKIEGNVFEQKILLNVKDPNDRDFLSRAFNNNQDNQQYELIITHLSKDNNIKRLSNIFKQAGFQKTEMFRYDSFQYFHKIYDIGNTYVHAKKNQKQPKKDATECLNMLAHIFSDVYGVNKVLTNQTIKSGYTDFPDICKGMNFAISVFSTPEDAMLGYYNLPSSKQVQKLLTVQGKWKTEWQSHKSGNLNGILDFFIEGEYLNAKLTYTRNKKEIIEPMDIKLFGSYFQIKGFDPKTMKHQINKHVHFEINFFNDVTLIGKNLENNGFVLFTRI